MIAPAEAPALRWFGQSGAQFSVDPGSHTALIESSPSHLRRLVRSMAGLSADDGVQVEIFGHQLESEAARAVEFISYCSLGAGLYEELTIRQYLDVFATMAGVASTAVEAVVELCGLSAAQNRGVRALSAQQRAYTHIARTLLFDRPVLLFDGLETLRGTDTAALLQLVTELREFNKTFIFCTGRLDALTRACTHAIVMAQTEVLFSDTMAHLLALLDASQTNSALHGIEVKAPAGSDVTGALRPLGVEVVTLSRSVVVWGRDTSREVFTNKLLQRLLDSGIVPSSVVPLDESPLCKRLLDMVDHRDP